MAEETVIVEEKKEVKEREPLFSKKNKKLITDPLDENNPVTIQVLGICSALAVTVQMKAAVVMSISVLIVLLMVLLIYQYLLSYLNHPTHQRLIHICHMLW